MTKVFESKGPEPSIGAPAETGKLSGFPVDVKQILAPTDLSEDSRKSLRYATGLARHFNAKLTILHVLEGRQGFDYVIGELLPEDARRELQVAEQRLDSLVQEVKKEYQEVEATVLIGNICSQIVDLAKLLRSNLIVVSTHNYPWFKRAMTGSDAEKIARHAPCPILIVHQHEHEFVD